MTLRERIEREMREAIGKAESVPGVLALTSTAHPAFNAAVEVAERLVREYEGMGDAVDVYRERAEAAEKERDHNSEGWNTALSIAAKYLEQRDEARKALAEVRGKWGHVRKCKCYSPDNYAQYRDPRCAPETGGGE